MLNCGTDGLVGGRVGGGGGVGVVEFQLFDVVIKIGDGLVVACVVVSVSGLVSSSMVSVSVKYLFMGFMVIGWWFWG
jgi:hypothetical protein